MIGTIIFGSTTLVLYGLGMYLMRDYIQPINTILESRGRPCMKQQDVIKFLLLWPYTVAGDILRDRVYD